MQRLFDLYRHMDMAEMRRLTAMADPDIEAEDIARMERTDMAFVLRRNQAATEEWMRMATEDLSLN